MRKNRFLYSIYAGPSVFLFLFSLTLLSTGAPPGKNEVKPFPKQVQIEYDEVQDVTTMEYGLEPPERNRMNLGLPSYDEDEVETGSNSIFGVVARFRGKKVQNHHNIQVNFSWAVLRWRKVKEYQKLMEGSVYTSVNAPEYIFSWDRPRKVWLLAHNGASPEDDKKAMRTQIKISSVNTNQGSNPDEPEENYEVTLEGDEYLTDDISYWTKERMYLQPITLPNAVRVLKKDQVKIKLPNDQVLNVPSLFQRKLTQKLKAFAEKYTTQ